MGSLAEFLLPCLTCWVVAHMFSVSYRVVAHGICFRMLIICVDLDWKQGFCSQHVYLRCHDFAYRVVAHGIYDLSGIMVGVSVCGRMSATIPRGGYIVHSRGWVCLRRESMH